MPPRRASRSPARQRSPSRESTARTSFDLAAWQTRAVAAQSATNSHTAHSILGFTQAIVLVDYMAVGGMRTVLPYYAKHLGASGKSVGGLETVYGVGQIGGAILLGHISDQHGRKV